MSTNPTTRADAAVCQHCEKRAPTEGAVSLWLNLPMLLLASPLWFLSGGWAGPPFPLGSYCEECGDKINFLGLVLWALAILGAIFLAIVLLA